MVLPVSPRNTQRHIGAIWVNPIFGNANHYRRYSYIQSGYAQAKPFNLDLPYDVMIARSIDAPAGSDTWSVFPDSFGDLVLATNKARAKFVNGLGETSQLGSTLSTELKASWATVSGGITNALLAANQVRRGRLTDAAKTLGFSPPVVKKVVRLRSRTGSKRVRKVFREYYRMPDGREVAKSLANKWLWYSYGVKPLLSDMHNAMDVLVRHVPMAKVVGFGSNKTDYYIGGFYQTRYEVKASVRISAWVRVTNPNLWLANQLGLINPVQMVNEGIRLSFVVDWFSNLSQIINQLTDFVGLEITRPVTSSKHIIIQKEYHPDYGIPMTKMRTDFKRRLIVPDARLVFAYERPNWQRGLNAISLLIGVLKTGRH